MNNLHRISFFIFFFIIQSSASLIYGQLLFPYGNTTSKIGFLYGNGGQEFAHISSGLSTQSQDEITSNLGFGGINTNNINLDTDYVFYSQFYQIQYLYTLLKLEPWTLELLVEPQINSSIFYLKNNEVNQRKFISYGIAVGGKINYTYIDDLLHIYSILSIGSHLMRNKQNKSNKAVLSQGLYIGIQIEIVEGFFVDIRPGFYRVKNNSLVSEGIYSMTASAGIVFRIRQKTKKSQMDDVNTIH